MIFYQTKDVSPNTVLTAHASTDRYIVPRKLLLEGRPDARRKLSDLAIKRLRAWLALRYSRPAWPESFVARIPKQAKERLIDALKPLKGDVAEVRIGISPKDQELDNDKKYKVTVYFVVPEEIFENSPDIRRLALDGFHKFVRTLKECDGFEFNDDSEVIPGNKFTWEMTQSTDLWDFAYLSPLE